MHLPLFLSSVLLSSPFIKYPLFFVGSVLEGPILFFVSGTLLRLGLVSLLPLFIALMMGDLVGDTIWYYIGYFFAEPMMRKRGKFMGITPEGFEKAKKLFNQRHEKILFTSKATLGFGTSAGTLLILMTAGMTRVHFGKFILLNFLGEFILLSLFLTAGFFFGGIYASVSSGLAIAFILGIMIILAFLIYLFRYNKSV